MAEQYISQITLPNNQSYSIKDNSQSRSIHNHITSDIKPLLSKTYENYTVTANDGNNGVIYFGTITPNNLDNYFAPWWIHYTLEITTSEIYTQGYYDVYIGAAGSSVTYHIFNNIYSTSYYPIYYHRLLYPKQNYQGQGAHIGVRVQSARNPATLARTYKINLLEQYGCTFSFKDSLVTYGTLYNETYYNTGEYTASPGLQETADNDTTGRDYSHSGYLINSSTFRMATFTLFGLDRENKAQGFSLYSSEYTSSTTNINTARVYNTAGFDWTRGIWHTNSWTNFAKNADLNISPAEFYYCLDLRYTDNCVAATTANNLGLVMRKPVYLRGYIKEDGLFYLDPISVTYNNATYQRAWTQDIPTTKTYHGTYRHVFWNIGMPYYNSNYFNSGYQINLHTENRLYWYSDNNRFEEYILEAQKVNGHTVEANVPSNAEFTDTITTLAISGSPSITNTPQSGAVTLGAAAAKSITDNSSNADVTSSDTNLITGRTLYYQLAKKGYTTNTGTVTNVATGSGLTGGPITTTGTISIATSGITNDMIANKTIANGKLANSSISIAGTSVSLGDTLAAETLRTNLGLSTAMHFRGIATVAYSDNTFPAISGYSTKEAGDVVIDKDSKYEYVWTGSAWELLGGDESYKTIQSAVSDPSASGNAISFIDTISQNTNGVISVTKKTIPTANGSTAGITTIGTTGGAAATIHTHGNIANDGTITSTGIALANGDYLLFSDSSNSGKIERSSITIGTATNTWLCNNGTWTTPPDTKVTSVGNHYAPSADNSAELTASISGTAGTYAKDTTYTVITGIKAQRDAKGHVTGITYTAQNIKDTNTTYTFTNKAASLSWGATTTIATVGGTDITVGLPANPNSDTKVTNTLGTTTKFYITGTTTSTTNTDTQYFDTGVYVTTTAGEISALRHSWHDPSDSPVEKAYSYWNPNNQSIDFVFN